MGKQGSLPVSLSESLVFVVDAIVFFLVKTSVF